MYIGSWYICLVIFPFAEAIPHILHLSTVASCRKYRQLPPPATKRSSGNRGAASVGSRIHICMYVATLQIAHCALAAVLRRHKYLLQFTAFPRHATPRQAAPFYCFSKLGERNAKKEKKKKKKYCLEEKMCILRCCFRSKVLVVANMYSKCCCTPTLLTRPTLATLWHGFIHICMYIHLRCLHTAPLAMARSSWKSAEDMFDQMLLAAHVCGGCGTVLGKRLRLVFCNRQYWRLLLLFLLLFCIFSRYCLFIVPDSACFIMLPLPLRQRVCVNCFLPFYCSER